ncbi:MAG: hypothetical protein JO316_11295 [Abitibacteriaceae bacterium]|nr:hypothetical protein [Abditibacteriaceae bacterium]
MSTASNFYKKVISQPDLAQVVFNVAVLEPYLNQSGVKVTRTDTVGRIKAASWTLDFGISPDEQKIHIALSALQQRLPEAERAHWLEHVDATPFSENFLKMQSSHACIDDGNFRIWGEESLF